MHMRLHQPELREPATIHPSIMPMPTPHCIVSGGTVGVHQQISLRGPRHALGACG
eukprot:CAMPEP_0202859080 /NCGR_PEP_ID=MMETSP1391-20130828/1358_1 /ASSEMBLY_ACC=CAM_ASM_000867 /TAXON_ID=1034604 /ORGANISM="Chlamydomonas leiostraca, Strain SAG 11-49" /LENGTH=54 /DNA_ID=CAMNT_0049538085 /DNA_START=75 /DNA_END=236 /DNA_ORIENTATION=+